MAELCVPKTTAIAASPLPDTAAAPAAAISEAREAFSMVLFRELKLLLSRLCWRL